MHTRAVELLKMLLTNGLVRCGVKFYRLWRQKLHLPAKKKKKDKIPLNDKKPFKMGKLSWVACHRLLPGSVPARGVFMHNRGAAFAVLMAKKTP